MNDAGVALPNSLREERYYDNWALVRALPDVGPLALKTAALALSDPTAEVRIAAILATCLLHPDDLFERLEHMLRDREYDVRVVAAFALLREDESYQPYGVLSDVLQRGSLVEKENALYVVSAHGERAAPLGPLVLKLVDDPDLADIAADALVGLGRTAGAYVPNLVAMVRSQHRRPHRAFTGPLDPVYETAAMLALGRILGGDVQVDTDAAVEVIVEILTDPRSESSEIGDALEALGTMGRRAQRAVPQIARIANDASQLPFIRRSAFWALGGIGDIGEQAVNVIHEALVSGNIRETSVLVTAIEAAGSVARHDKTLLSDLKLLRTTHRLWQVREAAERALEHREAER
jgi:HEAT repeat protein